MVALLVEKDIYVQFVMWKLLRANQFTVLTAEDGEAALEASRNYPGHVDLLLADLDMPRQNGLDLCKTITMAHPGIKTLVFSGDGGVREQAESDGFPCLQKPVDPESLQDSIRALLRSTPEVRGVAAGVP
jgi:DNA-binding response OmpR family regulator